MLIQADFVSSGCNGVTTALVLNIIYHPMTIAIVAKSELSNRSSGPKPTAAELKVDVKVLLACFPSHVLKSRPRVDVA
jgi:hypothetical protein